MAEFNALVTPGGESALSQLAVERRPMTSLPDGDLLIKVQYSSLNYKDALSASGHKGITKSYPHTPGIDAVGCVEHIRPGSPGEKLFTVGDEVIVTGFDLGMNTSGGFAEYIRVPSEWAVMKPASLSAKDAMILGTAGLTAAMSLDCLIQVGITPSFGPIAVTGATGGVGSLSIMLLKKLGYEAVAISGKADANNYLLQLGATEVMSRDALLEHAHRPMLAERWGGAIDTVGGEPLMALLKGIKYGGSVACCGMAASPEFQANVYPFILRGANLLGVDSAHLPIEIRQELWGYLSDNWALPQLESIVETVALADLPEKIGQMLKSQSYGRVVVEL